MNTWKQIADTIIQQLGGSRFIAMTGAHSFMADEHGALTFKLPAAMMKARTFAVRIKLNAADLYDVEFIRITRKHSVETVDNVSCDQLREVFERHTGLRTSL